MRNLELIFAKTLVRYTYYVYNIVKEGGAFMRNIPITLTLPESLVKDLHLYISRRQISKFVAQVVTKGLETEKQKLAREFQEASQDTERNAEIELWDSLSEDGLNEENAY